MNASATISYGPTIEISLDPSDNLRLANLCGQFDQHLAQIEKRIGVQINRRGHAFWISGKAESQAIAERVLLKLYETTRYELLTPESIHLHLQESGLQTLTQSADGEQGELTIHAQRSVIRTRGPNQRKYIEDIRKHDIIFGIGPAGTGKTYLAVACAVEALEHDRVRRVILVRPAVEAGERLGFLPGDIAQKVDPYLRPLYDALYEMLGFDKVAKYIERNVIEIAPLAFMRGRTLNESFIILDEAQNTTPEQMKMFLTRIGYGSTAVITGDDTQIDLPEGKKSGLRLIKDILKNVNGVSFTFFATSDVVRHPVVARVLDAYNKFEQQSKTESSA